MVIFDIFKKKDKKTDEALPQKNENVNVKCDEESTTNTLDTNKYLLMDNKEESLINYLKDTNWKIELNKDSYKSTLLSKRYESIPKTWKNFINKYSLITNENETTWFICFKDFDDENAEFKYNEFELISLESATDNGKEKIKEFWSNNIPIIMSVKNGYEYYAINIESGKIVYGFEPEFEESEIVAESFEDFITKVISGIIIL